MTTQISDLIDNFSNGKLPTGENFADLINSMVHRDAFDAHVKAFEDELARGQVQLGQAPNLWQIDGDADGQLRVLRCDSEGKVPATDEAGDILLGGWTTLDGRIGARTDADAFSAPHTEVDVAAMACVASDGGWHDIVEMPGHPCAFEITAATARPVYPHAPGLGTAVKSLLGITAEENGIVHGTCTATGGNRLPALTLTSQPDTGAIKGQIGAYFQVLAILVLGALLLVGTQAEGVAGDMLVRLAAVLEQGVDQVLTRLGIEGVDASIITLRYLPLTLLGLNALFVLRLLVRGLHLKRSAVRLRWKKRSGSALMDTRHWTLQLRGPSYPPGPAPAEVYYTITKLWN